MKSALIILIALTLTPQYLCAINQDKLSPHEQAQKETVKTITRLGKAVDKLIKKEDSIPSEITNMSELMDLLVSKKLIHASHPTVDGWGNPISFTRNSNDSYLIKSPGSDNKENTSLINDIPEGQYHMDIVWSSGEFLQAPAKYLEQDRKKRPRKSQQKQGS